jgi:ubiquinone/menaquinone biosynthesis C-methylase UbiE
MSSSASAAEVYDALFVPALFGQWGETMAKLARVQPGERVLDVACGTGALACAVAERVGPGGQVVGLDANEGMLEVARRKRDDVEWRSGRAESLPFPDASFDAVVSQFGLMFFEDRAAALREMMRVLRRGGRLAVAVWSELAESPGYAALGRLLDRLFGAAVGEAFGAPFALGDETKLRALCAEAGLERAELVRREGAVRFPSVEALLSAERAWLGDVLDDARFERLRAEAERELAPFVARDGRIEFPIAARIVRATRE